MPPKYDISQLKKALSLIAALADVGERIGDKNLGLMGKISLLISIKDELTGMDGFDFALAAQQLGDLDALEKAELVSLLQQKLDFTPAHEAAEKMIEDGFGVVVDIISSLEELIKLFKKPGA